MTEEQLAALRELISRLTGFPGLLDDLAEDALATPVEAQTELDALKQAFSALAERLEDDAIEKRVLTAARSLIASAGATLTAAARQGPADAGVRDSLAELGRVCMAQIATLNRLERKAKALLALPDELVVPEHRMMVHRQCVVQGRRVTVDGEPVAGGDHRDLAWTLAVLYDLGVRRLDVGLAVQPGAVALGWAFEAARVVFDKHLDRWDVAVNAPVKLPDGTTVLYLHLRYDSADRRLTLACEGTSFKLWGDGARGLDAVKQIIRTDLGMGEIVDDDAHWTVPELIQFYAVCRKLPVADRAALAGCRLVRRARPDEVDPDAKHEKASYGHSTHTITVLDAVFEADDYGFVGAGETMGPHAHWVLAHEIGHVVELRDWRKRCAKFDTADVDARIAAKEKEKRDLEAWLQGPGQQADTSLYAEKSRECTALGKEIGQLWDEQRELWGKRHELDVAAFQKTATSVCLERFLAQVQALGVAPFTFYAESSWAKNKKGELFAEAYTMFVNEPETLRWISPGLHDWFVRREYWVD
ncbi:hypothetical protein [Streptodolium elevatio]